MSGDLISAFSRMLAETERLSPDELRDYQIPLISKLLRHAQRTTDFYRDRFDFDLDSADEIDRHWSAVPILTRAEAVASRDRLLSRSVPPEAGETLDGQTSGSTGIPFPYKRSLIGKLATRALSERSMRWWNVDGARPAARIATDWDGIAPAPDGLTGFGWHSAHPQALSHLLSSEADVDTQLRWLAARKPSYLVTYPHLIKEIALASERTGTNLKFSLVRSLGMLLDQETRDICRAVLGCDIADAYGATEAGFLAAECPQCREYHISAEVNHLEVLRDDGSAAAPGEVGRVIVTSLYNYAMPLIRYEVGDLAEVGSPSSRCGRGLPLLRRIVGRYRNVFRFRDGTIKHPGLVHFKVGEFLPLKQMQVVQLDYDRIEIRWVSDGSDRPCNLDGLTAQIRSVLQQPVEVSLRRLDAIERAPSGKFEDCISLVPHG